MVLRSAEDLLTLYDQQLGTCADEVRALCESYVAQRKQIMEARSTTRNYGLFLKMEVKTCEETAVRRGYVYWKYGRLRHNVAKAQRLRGGRPITNYVRRTSGGADYSRADLKSVMPYCEKWEIAMTMQYELEVRKVRRYLEYLRDAHNAILRPPAFPDLRSGGLDISDYL